MGRFRTAFGWFSDVFGRLSDGFRMFSDVFERLSNAFRRLSDVFGWLSDFFGRLSDVFGRFRTAFSYRLYGSQLSSVRLLAIVRMAFSCHLKSNSPTAIPVFKIIFFGRASAQTKMHETNMYAGRLSIIRPQKKA